MVDRVLGPAVETAAGPAARVYNFAATGGVLPPEVIERACEDLRDWKHSRLSVLELPFTGSRFRGLLAEAQALLRSLLRIPDDYRVLFTQGGASAQFSLVPLNLLGDRRAACYADSGYWSRRAISEAQRYCRIEWLSPHEVPDTHEAAYLHITSNETAEGWQYGAFPDPGAVPLVADMTSDFLTRPIDVSRFGVIYASAQKNIGAAGLTIVIVREDLLGRAHPATPSAFDYRVQAQAESLYNTPPMFAIHLAALVFKWLASQGGLEAMQAATERKSARLYAAIDDSKGFYRCEVPPAERSHVNVCFKLANDMLTRAFIDAAESQGMRHLAGHSRIGGVRSSLYLALSEDAASALADFMKDFARRRG